uniref:Required for meiotic nuclear division 5 homolog B n=1 Tax=Scleropages formosus TaxID=113540 RepID=A0A8C9RYH5_SCLFO
MATCQKSGWMSCCAMFVNCEVSLSPLVCRMSTCLFSPSPWPSAARISKTLYRCLPPGTRTYMAVCPKWAKPLTGCVCVQSLQVMSHVDWLAVLLLFFFQNFDAEVSAVVAETVWDSPERQKYLSETIVEHLYRQGMLSVAEDLCQESGVVIDTSLKQPFLELNRILEALRMQDLRPALEWAVANRQRLLDLNSSLEFKLHRLYFISLLNGGMSNQLEALQYARHFQPFASQHQRDIQILMGSLVYLRHGIENSPYRSLLEPNQWAEICTIFTRDACALLGLSVESPLSVSFASGCMALPVLMNIKQVIEQRQCSGVWTHKDELPIEIDLGKKCWYHSVFACPILRQQTSESNPPMKLICGHVISRDALNKLTNAGKLKCPYCPMEQNPSDAKQIFF